MAFSVQYPPQTTPFPNQWQNLMGGMKAGQEGIAKNLEIQKARTENKYLDKKLVAELESMLALTEKNKAQTSVYQEELKYMPQQIEAEMASERALKDQRRALQNKYNVEAQHMPAKIAAEIEAQKALADQRRNKPSSGSSGSNTGIAGQLQAYNDAILRGDPNANLIMQGIEKTISGGSNDFKAAPRDVQRSIHAKAVGLGMDPSLALKRLNEGATIEDIASEMGISKEKINEYPSIFSAQQSALTAAQKREAAEAELEYLSPRVAEWIEPYADPIKVFGYSPSQIKDAVTGQNPEQQAKFFAASAIFPELTYMRLRLAGGESGITSLQHMEDALAGKVKQFEPFMTKEVYSRFQEILAHELSTASKIANEAIYDPVANAARKKEKQKENEEVNTEEESDPLGIR